MKLGSLKTGGRDGSLIVVDRQLQFYVAVPEIAASLQQAIDSLGALADMAQRYGVTLCVKAHVGASIYDTPTTLQAMKEITSPAFGIDMDPSHIHRANENPVEAIAAVSLVQAESEEERWNLVLDNIEGFAGEKLSVLEEVYTSEYETSWSNRAIANLLFNYGGGWMSLSYDDYDGELIFARGALEYWPFEHVGLGAGYSYISADVDRDTGKKKENYDVEMPGPIFYLTVGF